MNTDTIENNGVPTILQGDAMLSRFQYYRDHGGALSFAEWSNTVEVIGKAIPEPRADMPSTLGDVAHIRHGRQADDKPHTASRADIKATKRGIRSKSQSKANGKHRPALDDAAALAVQHVAEERKIYAAVRAAVRAFEQSSAKRDASILCAQYFGQGTVKGMTKPLWRARFDSQREAVAYMWSIALIPDNKPILDAKVQLMVRLRADGYRLLKVAPPVKDNSGRTKTPIVDRAVTASKRFLGDMSADDRLAFLSRISKTVKDMNGNAVPVKTPAAKPSKQKQKQKRAA